MERSGGTLSTLSIINAHSSSFCIASHCLVRSYYECCVSLLMISGIEPSHLFELYRSEPWHIDTLLQIGEILKHQEGKVACNIALWRN